MDQGGKHPGLVSPFEVAVVVRISELSIIIFQCCFMQSNLSLARILSP